MKCQVPTANVVHMGDTFRDRFPFIDTATGGSIDGMIAASGVALAVMDAPGMVPSRPVRIYGGTGALKTMRDAVAELMEPIMFPRPIRPRPPSWRRAEKDL